MKFGDSSKELRELNSLIDKRVKQYLDRDLYGSHIEFRGLDQRNVKPSGTENEVLTTVAAGNGELYSQWSAIEGIAGFDVQAFTATGSIVAGDGHFVTFTGAASQTLSLPSASIGDWYHVLNIDGSDVVTVARVGSDTINGGASVEVGSGDSARIVCTAAATWIAIFDRFPWKARISLSAAGNHTSSGSFQKVPSGGGTWSSTYDVRPDGASAQTDVTTNKRIDIRRAGLYLVQGNVTFTAIGTSTSVTAGAIYVNGSGVQRATGYAWTTSGARSHYMSGTGGLAVGDYVELFAFQNESASEAYAYDGLSTWLHDTYLSVQWLGPSGSG